MKDPVRPPTRGEPFAVDPTSVHPDRVFNYLHGGKDNFEADRKAAEYIYAALPGGIESARAYVRESARFMRRTVRHLTEEVGLRQFLNIGPVAPALPGNVHDIVQRSASDGRVVYVVRDPTVLAQAHRLLHSSPEGAIDVLPGDLRDPAGLVARAGGTLDLDRPVAVLLIGTLNFVPERREPHRIVAQLMEPLAPGSYLAISHIASDVMVDAMAEAARRQREVTRTIAALPFVARSRAQVAAFFDGLALMGPGVVEIDLWRPHGVDDSRDGEPMFPIYAGLGRKPDPAAASSS